MTNSFLRLLLPFVKSFFIKCIESNTITEFNSFRKETSILNAEYEHVYLISHVLERSMLAISMLLRYVL